VRAFIHVGIAKRGDEALEQRLLRIRYLDADQDAAVVGAVIAVMKQADVPVRVQLPEKAGECAGAFGKFKAV